MPVYNNSNLMFVKGSQFVAYAGTSETVTLQPGTKAVTLYADSDCWITIGSPGETPVAAAPSGEKTFARSFAVRTDTVYDVAVPLGSEAHPVKIAVIQATAGGNLDVIERSDG